MISGQVSVLIGAPASRKIKLDVAPVVRLCRARSPSPSQIALVRVTETTAHHTFARKPADPPTRLKIVTSVRA